jgi:hypothetical protein
VCGAARGSQSREVIPTPARSLLLPPCSLQQPELMCLLRAASSEVYEVVHVHELTYSSSTMSWEYAKNNVSISKTKNDVRLINFRKKH